MAENVQISLGVNSNTQQAQQDVAALSRALRSLQDAASAIGRGGNIADFSRQIKAATSEIAHIKGRADIAKAMEAFTETPNIGNLTKFANAVSAEYNRTAKEVKAASLEIDRSMRGADTFDARGAEATAEAAKDIDSSMRGADTSISKASESMKEMGSSTSKTNGVFKNFIGSLTRIAKLRLLRGIIRSVTQAFREGTENIYQYSAALGSADASHFKSTMDGLASSFLYLKNSIGSVVAPLLGSLVPALQTVIGWVSAALNVLAQFFAVLNGQSTYTRAKQQATEWKAVGAAAGGAAAAAKEYKNTIMSFDELHVLDSPSEGGGGGGGGAGSPDFGDMFEEAELATDGIAGAFNKLATAVKPIVKGIWDFTKNTVETVLEGLGLGFDALFAVISGDVDQIMKVFDDLGVFVSKHKVIKAIVNATLDISKWIQTAISDVRLWLLGLYEDFINLPFVSAILEVLGFDVKQITDNIEEQKRAINDHKKEIALNRRQWELWADGVDSATAHAIVNINAVGLKGIDAFTNMKKTTDGTKSSIDNVSSSINAVNNLRPSFSGVTNGLGSISNSAYTTGQNVRAIADALEAINRIGKVQASILVTGAVAALNSRAEGGYVTGYANGGMIPSYASGGVNSADLFMANESGNPELVGRIGSRTAVANQGQMVEALASGIYRAMTDAQSGSSSNVEVVVQMDGVAVARANDRGQKALNRRFNVQLA